VSRTSATRRRTAAAGVLGALLGGALLTLPAGGPGLQAVAVLDGAVPDVAGVTVVRRLPAVHMAVVRGDRAAMVRLAGARGVLGLAPDDGVQLAGHDERLGGGVLAAQELGGAAGRPGAGAGVRVAVVDTGVSDTAALDRASGRLVDGVDTSGGTAPGPYEDGFGHGTFMADLVAGGPFAGRVLGVAPAATVVVVRVASADGLTSLSRVVAGLDWIAAHRDRVDLANLSFSHERPSSAYGEDPLTRAVERVRAAGVAVVAAGNHPGHVGDPGLDPFALTVGAADLGTERVASFSGSGRVAGMHKPDVVASGVGVLGLLPPDSVLARATGTAHLADGLFRGSGTSQSTAITSGAAALLLAEHPEATPTQVTTSLRCAADPLPGQRDGAGLLRTTTSLCSGPNGEPLPGSADPTGDGPGRSDGAASTWAASTWAASTWAASTWAASTWAASTWATSSWGPADSSGSAQ